MHRTPPSTESRNPIGAPLASPSMPQLVALALTGPAFVDELRRAWDDGDAVLPIDPRLPPGRGGGDPRCPPPEPDGDRRRATLGPRRRHPDRGRRCAGRPHQRQHGHPQGRGPHPRHRAGLRPLHQRRPGRRSRHGPLAVLPPPLPHRRALRRHTRPRPRRAARGPRRLRRRRRHRRGTARRHAHDRGPHRPGPIRPLDRSGPSSWADRHPRPRSRPTAGSATG